MRCPMLKAYLIYFDVEIMKIQAEVIEINNSSSEIFDKQIHQLLNTDGYDFYDYNDEIAILVDDRGFDKELNPIFEIKSDYGDISHLAGRLIFVRNIENEFSIDIGSIKHEDIFNLRLNLDIKLIGMTKGGNKCSAQ